MTVSWPKVRINEAGHVQAGRQRSPSIVAGLMRPYLRVANVHDGYIDYHDVLEMPFSDSEFEVFSLRQGDILLNEGQSLKLVGRSAVYEGPARKYCFQNSLIRFRASDKIDITFAHLMFQHLLSSGVFASIATRTTSIAHLGVERFAAILIPLPDMGEQRAISRVFSAWDSAIGQLSDLIAAKVRFKQGLMKQLLAGRLRYPQFSDDWNKVLFKDVTDESIERNRGRLGSQSVMAVTKAEGIVPMRERTIGADINRYSVVKKDCFAYNPMRLNIGSIARWMGDQDILVSPDYVVFQCKLPVAGSPAITPDFLDHYRRSWLWGRYVESSGNGSVRVRIYFDDLGGMPLKLPSLKEQRAIANVLNSADCEISLLQRELAALKLQKRVLMQKLFTGEVRLKLPSCSGSEE
jgi:type I restriction enzyme S subunit